MNIKTRDFGNIKIDSSDIITFKRPIYGFESCEKYILLCDEEIGEHFSWLQSLDDPELCFILVDPSILPISYSVEIPEDVCEILNHEDCDCWNIAVIPEDFKNATVNLKSPILISSGTHLAAQVILEQDYPIRAPLMQTGGENEPC